MSAVAIVAALAAALAVERRISIAIFHATYDDGPDALAAALSAGRAAYRSVAPRWPTRDELALLDAAITAAITVHRAADPAVDPGGAP